jgi:SAM-dependent methyltransferase
MINIIRTWYLHNKSKLYWRRSKNSFLASESFYAKQEVILKNIINNGNNSFRGSLLDLGCGSGRFTLLFAPKFSRVIGVDISKHLIDQARKDSARLNLEYIKFIVSDIEKVKFNEKFDVILCLGVLSTIIDDQKAQRLISRYKKWLRSGGLLLTRESLCILDHDEYLNSNYGYVSNYRSKESYLRMITDNYFTLESETESVDEGEKKGNTFYDSKSNYVFVFKSL